MYRLVCIDMDGTLLDHNFTIPMENITALREAINKGVEIALVSGRPYNIGKYFADLIAPEVHVIGTNGTYFKYKDLIYEKALNKEQINRVYNAAVKYNLIVHFKGYNKLISNRLVEADHPYKLINPKLKDEAKIEIIENASIDTVLAAEGGDIFKAIAFSQNKEYTESIKTAKEELKQYDDLEVVSSSARNFEVMMASTSKAEAVKTLSGYLGIDRSEIMCIGDNENDISMIKYAALGVAMGNGSEDIKAAADYITDTNDKAGVAKAISKFIFNT